MEHFTGLNLKYWTSVGTSYLLVGSNLGNFRKTTVLDCIRPDWGNTARADMAGLGPMG